MPVSRDTTLIETHPTRYLVLLVGAAAILFTAGTSHLSLPSLDDCFYARKGVEMHQRGASLEVTWNGHATFQNPPAQFWLLATSFELIGYNDFAARLPSILMALGILLGVFSIGEKTVGREASLLGICLLLLSPYFTSNARRCMLEVPLTFWLVAAIAVFVRGIERPRLHILFFLPLAAAMLTKSLLAFIGVFIVGGTIALSPELRRSLDKRWIVFGTAMGVFIGLSWSFYLVHQHGLAGLRAHYVEEIFSRSSKSFDLGNFFLDYPSILFRDFQIAIIPAVLGAILLWKCHDIPRWVRTMFFVWLVAFPVMINFSSARTARYIFPIIPALALTGGYWLDQSLKRFSRHLYIWIVPSLSVLAAIVFWVHPSAMTRDRNAPMKQSAAFIQESVSPSEAVPYFGENYWVVANPLMYYAHRQLALPSSSPQTAASKALANSARLLFCSPGQWPALRESGHVFTVVLETQQWLLLRVEDPVS